ncbi:MAG: protein-L-isoaspartate O-methyltransferase [Dermatophilaceae bacterium]
MARTFEAGVGSTHYRTRGAADMRCRGDRPAREAAALPWMMQTGEERLTAAFQAAPREGFLRRSQQRYADTDGPLPIGRGVTSSQPSTVRTMLGLLDVQPGQRVLDIGAGSGWTTALLANLVGPAGSVLGLEILPDIAAWGAANLGAAGVPWARLEAADPSVLGRPGEAPYDRILVSAMAHDIPDALLDQLAEDGVLVLPLAGRMGIVRRRPGALPDVRIEGHYRFVPLLEPDEWY